MITNFDTKMKGWMEWRSIILSILREIFFKFKTTLPKIETGSVFKSNVLIWTKFIFSPYSDIISIFIYIHSLGKNIINTVNTYKYYILKLLIPNFQIARLLSEFLFFFCSIMLNFENVYKEAQSSLDNIWIFKLGFFPFKNSTNFSKLISSTLVRTLGIVCFALRKMSVTSPKVPGRLFAQVHLLLKVQGNQLSFIIRLVVAVVEKVFWAAIVSSESRWSNFDDNLGNEREEVTF